MPTTAPTGTAFALTILTILLLSLALLTTICTIITRIAETHADPTTVLNVTSIGTARRALNLANRIDPTTQSGPEIAARHRHLCNVHTWAAHAQHHATGNRQLRIVTLYATAHKHLTQPNGTNPEGNR